MKVGKAIYNILSRALPVQQNIGFSTDTFAPSGEELVTNGNFSATGSELVTNGDFANDSNWNKGTGWSIANDKASCDGSQSAATNLKQLGIVPIFKSYKVVFDIVVDAGSLVVAVGGSNAQPTITSTNTYTYYTQATQGDANFYFTAGATFVGSVTNVSVKELGEGWTLGTGWSIGNLKAISNGSQSSNSNLYQSLYTVNKSYKTTINVIRTAGTLKIFTGTPSGTLTITANGSYEYIGTASSSTTLYIQAQSDFVGSVTNVSVQEMILTKIFPEIAPPDINPPYIVYSVVSNQPSNTKNENGEIDEASLEVYSFQDTYNKTVDLGVAVRASLDRVNGTFATVKVDSINYTNEQMDVNESRKLWAAIQDYTVRIKNI